MYGLMPFEKKNYDVFNAFRDFEKDFFGDKFPVESCKTDIKDDGSKYIVETELPGFDKKDISIDINGNYLTISAKHSEESEDKDKSGKYIHRERSYGSYRRSFDISEVAADGIDAEYKNGVLVMTLPKKPEAVPTSKRLEIK